MNGTLLLKYFCEITLFQNRYPSLRMAAEDGTYAHSVGARALTAVKAAGARGCTSRDVLRALNLPQRPEEAPSHLRAGVHAVLEALSAASVRASARRALPVLHSAGNASNGCSCETVACGCEGCSESGEAAAEKPLVRLRDEGTDEVVYVFAPFWRNHGEVEDVVGHQKEQERRCFLCAEGNCGRIDGWQLMGGGYTNDIRVARFRSALVLCICERCFREKILGDDKGSEPVGFAVLPANFFGVDKNIKPKKNATISTLNTRESSIGSTLSAEMELHHRVLEETVNEVRNFGVKGGTWHDIIEKVRLALMPRIVDDLREIVQWSLHISSSKRLQNDKPLLRRAMVGFDGEVQILFIAKEFIDPDMTGDNSPSNGIRLEIGEQAVPGAMFGLRPFTTFKIRIDNPRGPEHPEVVRRFSDFVWLREELVRWYGDEAMVPPLPRKQFLGRFNESFLEARMHSLEQFLSIVATHPQLHNAEALQVFFKVGGIEDFKDEYATNEEHRSLEKKKRRKMHSSSDIVKRASLRRLGRVSEMVVPSPTHAVVDGLRLAEIRTEICMVLNSKFQKRLRKCYKAMDALSNTQLRMAANHEERAKAIKFLAKAELPEIQDVADDPVRQSELVGRYAGSLREFSDIPLSTKAMPLAFCALSTVELLSSLSRMDVLAATAHRASCIRLSNPKMQMKQWHRSLEEFSSWFENRAQSVNVLERSIKQKRELLDAAPLMKSNADSSIGSSEHELLEEKIHSMEETIARTRADSALEATWLVARNRREIATKMTSFVQLQIEHAKQMRQMWQDFLPQILTSLEAKLPVLPKPNEFCKDGNTLHDLTEVTEMTDFEEGSSGLPMDPEIDPSDIIFGDCIGRGSFGEVHEGVFHGQRVAIKKIPSSSMSSKALTDFRREAKVLRGLPPHPNLISFYGMCSDPNNVCLVMELVTSDLMRLLLGSLKERTRTPLSNSNCLKLALGTARGIHVLHSNKPQILHRDIKTSNLLVSMPDLTVKVCDFGLARFKLENQRVRSFVGTASWVAPEVIVSHGEAGYSSKADVYSFAIVLWQIFARQLPYPNMHQTQVLFQVARDGLRPGISANTPKEMEDLIRKCWEHDPRIRPDFEEICNILENFSFN